MARINGKKIIFFTHGKVNPYEESGMSRVVYYRAKYLRKMGFRCEVVSVYDGVKEFKIYERDEFVKIKLFPRVFSPYSRGKNSVINYFKQNIDKILLVDINLMWYLDKVPIVKLLKKSGVPYVVTAHGAYTEDKIKLKWWKKVPAKYLYELYVLNNSSGVIAQTPEELSSLREFGVNVKIFKSSIGIDKGEVINEANMKYGMSEKVVFGFVGNIVPVKNLHNLILAINLLPQTVKQKIQVQLVGPTNRDKKYFNILKQLILKNGLKDIIHFLGPLYRDEKREFLKKLDCYIHVSTSETISLAALEAMAVGKPLIISRTSHVSYLYPEGFFIMVEPWYDQIAEGILRFLSLPLEKRKEMGKNALKTVLNKFSWDKVVEGYVEIIHELTAKYYNR